MTSRVDELLGQLADAIRNEVKAEFLAKLSDEDPVRALKRAAFGVTETGEPYEGPLPVPRTTRAKPPVPARRSPDDMAKIERDVLEVIRTAPGQNCQQLADIMSLPVKEMRLPLEKLREKKAVKITGHSRWMKYFPKGK